MIIYIAVEKEELETVLNTAEDAVTILLEARNRTDEEDEDVFDKIQRIRKAIRDAKTYDRMA